MKKVLSRKEILLALALLVASGTVAHSDGRDTRGYAEEQEHQDGRGQEGALRALENGQARPLVEILEIVRERLGGEVVGVDFERRGGRFAYEFKVVTPSGNLREIYVDALTAVIISGERD